MTHNNLRRALILAIGLASFGAVALYSQRVVPRQNDIVVAFDDKTIVRVSYSVRNGGLCYAVIEFGKNLVVENGRRQLPVRLQGSAYGNGFRSLNINKWHIPLDETKCLFVIEGDVFSLVPFEAITEKEFRAFLIEKKYEVSISDLNQFVIRQAKGKN